MHLRTIRARGFKSFPEPVEIRLEPGVAVVVGPNGSGKSNVADAIVWAAGSLTPSELRAEKPDDVLFAGSAGRGPADFCEVELVFDNEDGEGPVPFSELSIKRRLHRGGEGQYLLNGTAVRRIDLVELLADLGLGGGMHSIIGQGRVEEVLGASSARRRELIEDAAGLGRFKRRKHRAELKLARVAIQVERARDVEEEVRKRLRPLALQATAAERAERLGVEVARLRARIAELDVAAVEERRAEADGRRTAAALARRHAEARLEEVLAERARAEDELGDAAGRREAATAELYRLRSGAERLTLRAESAEALAGAVRTALDEASAAAADGSADELTEASTDAERAARARDDAAAAARGAHQRLVALRRARHEAALGLLATFVSERGAAHDEARRAVERRDGLAVRMRDLATGQDRLGVRLEGARALAGAVGEALEDVRVAAGAAGPSPRELKEAADAAAAAARAAARERDELAERAGLARERLAAVESALAEREGVPPAARALSEAGERLALDELAVEPGAERAVTAALAWRAAAVVAPDTRAALRLAERARTEGLGSLAVLTPRAADAAAPPVAGARPLREVAPGAAELLPDVWLVGAGDLLDATAGVVVTTDGLGYDPARGEVWFAGDTPESALLELETRARVLRDEAAQLEGAARAAAARADALGEEAEAAEAAFQPVAALLTAAPADPVLVERVAAAARRLEAALAAGDAVAARLAPVLEAALEGSARDAERLDDALRTRLGREERLRADADAAGAAVAAAELALAKLGEGETTDTPGDDADAVAARAVALAAEAAAAAEHADAAARRLDEVERRLGGAGRADRAALARIDAVCIRLNAALVRAVDSVGALEAPVRARVDAGAHRVTELGAELRRLGAAEVELRREAAEAGERVAAVDVELARIDADRDEAARRLEAAGADVAAEGDDRQELTERAERLERRRETLGRVNPLAKEEYEAEKVRLEELSTQREDLERSLQELDRLRAELTETVETRFAETFAAVEVRFAEVARTLFPGGEGRLRLTIPEETEGDERAIAEPTEGTSRFAQTAAAGPLRAQAADAAGVEVELRPAGKKITRLSLLSGGEKALGAISFLFALFLARPCPFYLLDEVEAALDDTNIGRFVELLRRHADEAQFVVITHQKRTMEAADVLYGVTMGGDGVSQIVSRRLPREDARELATA